MTSTSTESNLSQVLAWQKAKPEESSSLIGGLNDCNNEVEESLSQLDALLLTYRAEAIADKLEKLGSQTHDSVSLQCFATHQLYFTC